VSVSAPISEMSALGAVGPEPVSPSTLERLLTLGWSGFESGSRQILSLLFFFATVRFLQPSDLGAFALAVALNGFLGIFIDEPFGEALVQKAQVTEADWDTGYTINMLVALACLLLSCGVGVASAILLHQPLLMFAVPVLASSSVLGALGNIHKAYLSRLLRFRTIAQTTLFAQLLAGAASLGVAAAGFGYWALIVNVVVAAAVTSSVYRRVSPWKPHWRIDPVTVRARASYVGYAVGVRLVYLVRDQSPYIIAGALFDLRAVGYLGLAIRVARALGQVFEEVTSRPLMSLISRQQSNLTQFGAMLAQILMVIGLLAFPGFVGLSELGTQVISIMLGPEWAPAGALLPFVCAALGGWLLLHVVAVSLRARGLAHLALLLTAPAALADMAVFAAAAPFGLSWALRGWAARAVLALPMVVIVLSAKLGVPLPKLVRIWGTPIAASLLMLLVLRWLQGIHPRQPGAGGLGLLILAGAAAYGLAVSPLAWQAARRRFLLRVPE
jgi:O-antigen/teichoic acid export membrane protein